MFSVVFRVGKRYRATDARFKTVKAAFDYILDSGSRMVGVGEARIWNQDKKEYTKERWTPNSYAGQTVKEATHASE